MRDDPERALRLLTMRVSGVVGSVGLHVLAMLVLRSAAANYPKEPEARLPIELVTTPAPEPLPTPTPPPVPESVTPNKVETAPRRAVTTRSHRAPAPTPGEAAPGPGDSSEPPLLDGTLSGGGDVAMGTGGGGGHGVGGGGGKLDTAGGGGKGSGGSGGAPLQVSCDEAAMQALFPATAKGEGILSMVVPVRVQLGPDGTIAGASAEHDPGHGFGPAAVTAVRRYCRVRGKGSAETIMLRVKFVQD